MGVLSCSHQTRAAPPHLLGSHDRETVVKEAMQLDLLAMDPLAVAASFDAAVRAKALAKLRLPAVAATTSSGSAKTDIQWHRIDLDGDTNDSELVEEDSSKRRVLEDLLNDGRFVPSCEIRQQLEQVDDASPVRLPALSLDRRTNRRA